MGALLWAFLGALTAMVAMELTRARGHPMRYWGALVIGLLLVGLLGALITWFVATFPRR